MRCESARRYPIPKMRALPISFARTIAGHAGKFKLFGTIYILTGFIVTPLVTRSWDAHSDPYEVMGV